MLGTEAGLWPGEPEPEPDLDSARRSICDREVVAHQCDQSQAQPLAPPRTGPDPVSLVGDQDPQLARSHCRGDIDPPLRVLTVRVLDDIGERLRDGGSNGVELLPGRAGRSRIGADGSPSPPDEAGLRREGLIQGVRDVSHGTVHRYP
jgi:hypothetical protein